jgi:hypothetical protein
MVHVEVEVLPSLTEEIHDGLQAGKRLKLF